MVVGVPVSSKKLHEKQANVDFYHGKFGLKLGGIYHTHKNPGLC